MKKVDIEKRIKDSNLKFHLYAIISICTLFCIINLIQKSYVVGVATFILGILTATIYKTVLNDKKKVFKGIFLTQMALVIIFIMSAINGEIHTMFSLIIAATALGGMYYSEKNIEISWIISDVVLIIGVFFKNVVYVGADINLIVKGLVGLNIAMFMIRHIMKNNIAAIGEADDSAEKSAQLVIDVKNSMKETEKMAEAEERIMKEVSEIANNLEISSHSMKSVADKINESSQEQAASIQEISAEAEEITNQSEKCMEEAENAAQAAKTSVNILEENNVNMQKLVESMNEINESSRKISSIIKTIEDISFQTNILALNAAVEAARAGAAGKGFAVVADEVRNLANKSAEAANNTAKLINESIAVVDTGTEHAMATAAKMNEIIETSNMSERHAIEIEKLIQEQLNSVNGLRNRIESVSNKVIDNTQAAEESAEVASAVSEEIQNMYRLVTNK